MNDKRVNSSPNDYSNNHIRFSAVMELYITLSYTIKYDNIGLLQNLIQEVCIILQATTTGKSKYAQAMIKQLHIFDTKAFDFLLQEAYLANALIKFCGLPKYLL